MNARQLMAMFCDIEDFCKAFEPVSHPQLLHSGQRIRTRGIAVGAGLW
jgi:hypothetical protein